MADTTELVDKLSGLTVLEIADLVKQLEEKWGDKNGHKRRGLLADGRSVFSTPPRLTALVPPQAATLDAVEGIEATDRFFAVPLDHQRPDGEQIEVFAREVVAADKAGADLPWLLFLQGGPGFGAQRPEGRNSWLNRALEDRVLEAREAS